MLISFFIIAFLNSSSNVTCGCETLMGFNESKIVFTGTVNNIKYIEDPLPYERYEVTLNVSKWLKGGLKKKTIKINTPSLQSAACGVPFEVGSRYMVYCFERDNMLYTSDCTMISKIGGKGKYE